MSKRVPLQLTGPSYIHPSRPTNYQRCINMYPTYSGASLSDVDANNPLEQGRGACTLIRTAGAEIYLANPAGVTLCRGVVSIAINADETQIFFVFGNRVVLERITSSGANSYLLAGTLTTSTGRVTMNYNQTYLMITCCNSSGSINGASYYNYVSPGGGGGTVTTISDSDFDGGSHVAMIDGYFIVNNPNSAQVQSSDLNTPIAWTAANIAQMQGNPDNLVGLGQTKSELWGFGANSIEVWYDAGNSPGFPFSKRVGSDINVGCSAPFSITSINDKLYWIDSRRFVAQSDFSTFFRNQSSGYQITKISTEAIDAELASYSRVDDAIGATYNDNGHIMYELTFPTANKTWVFDTSTRMWHQKASIAADGTLACNYLNDYGTAGNLILAASGTTANNVIYEINREFLTDRGNPIPRIRTSQHFTDNFNEITLNELEVKCDIGKLTPNYIPGTNPITVMDTVTSFYFNPISPDLIDFLVEDEIPEEYQDPLLVLNVYFFAPGGVIASFATPQDMGGGVWGFQMVGPPYPLKADIPLGTRILVNSETSTILNEPKISLRYSGDSGYTWSNSMTKALGNSEKRDRRVIWGPLGSNREWTLELSTYDQVDLSIIDASANIDVEQA